MLFSGRPLALTALESISLGSEVSSIEEEVFKGCLNLNTVAFYDTLSHIDEHAFAECSSLQLYMTVTDLKARCASRVLPDHPMHFIVDGKPLRELTVPDGVTVIAEDAFRRAVDLVSLTVPESVTSIESFAFFGCPALTKVILPDTDIRISETAFDDIHLPPYTNDPEAFTHCYRYTETPSENAVLVKDVGYFTDTACTEEETKALTLVCNGWKWTSGERSYTDYSCTDFEWSYDGPPDYKRTHRKLYPRHCLVKDGEVIGFFLDDKAMLFSKPYDHREISDNARFEHCTDYFWRLHKR